MKKLLPFALLLLLPTAADAQNIGINANGATPNTTAILDIDVSAISGTKRGLLIPRVTTAERTAMTALPPATSLLVFDTSLNMFYYWDGTLWVPFLTGTTGWTTLGNAGTNATTNFIGTTDANAWVIKTGGSAATNERIRVLAGGQTVLNNTGLGSNTNDVFSVYSTGTTNGTTNISALGARAVNGYASGTGVGLFGNNTGTAANSFAIYGTTTSTTGTANAIRGEAASVNGVAVTGIANTSGGVVPTATNTRGVIGQVNGTLTGTANAIGTMGIINATMTTGDARGLHGQSPADNGTGVLALATSTATTGLPAGTWGQSASASGIGAIGINTAAGATALNPTGVLGQATNATGFGVDGFNVNVSGTGVLGEGNGLGGFYLIAGSGGAFTGSNTGTFTYGVGGAGTGLLGVGNGLPLFGSPAGGAGVSGNGATTGVYGVATNVATGTGVVAVGNNAGINTLVAGSGVAGTGTNFGVYGLATSNAVGSAGAPARAGGYFVSGTGGTQTFTYVACYEGGGTPRKVMGNGTVNTVVKNEAGDHVLLSAPEAPENLFQDLGTGQLVNGRVHISLDPTFSRNILVNEQHPLRVFVQLRGDCRGVYVENETAEGFDVVELQGGTSNAKFFWTVSGNRANQVFSDGTVWPFAEERFAKTAGPQLSVAGTTEETTTNKREVRVVPERTAVESEGQ